MTDLNKTERFYLAHCVLLLITFIAAIVVTFGLMYMARRRGDPARWSLTLIKVAAVFYCLSVTSPLLLLRPVTEIADMESDQGS